MPVIVVVLRRCRILNSHSKDAVYQIDSREKARAIQKVLAEFEKQGIRHFVSKLPIGDYANYDNPRVVVDRKQSLAEVAVNVGQDHARFKRELERAQEYGIHLIFLVEHGGQIKTLEDVQNWVNPRLKEHPLALTGPRLYKIMLTMQNKYGIEWLFCDKRCTGKRIIELLSGEEHDDEGTD